MKVYTMQIPRLLMLIILSFFFVVVVVYFRSLLTIQAILYIKWWPVIIKFWIHLSQNSKCSNSCIIHVDLFQINHFYYVNVIFLSSRSSITYFYFCIICICMWDRAGASEHVFCMCVGRCKSLVVLACGRLWSHVLPVQLFRKQELGSAGVCATACVSVSFVVKIMSWVIYVPIDDVHYCIVF